MGTAASATGIAVQLFGHVPPCSCKDSCPHHGGKLQATADYFASYPDSTTIYEDISTSDMDNSIRYTDSSELHG
jgi:hypothetical protein